MKTAPEQVKPNDEFSGALATAAELPRDLALIKMENESIMALAAAHPRNHAAVLADIKDQLATYKSFAENAMYAKPVGRGDDNKMKYARGLSIRSAEAIASAYGFNRCHIEVTPLGDDAARVEATFVDYQTGRVFQKGSIVSKVYKGRNGQTRRHSDDRFYDIVCEAAGSKRLRECILRTVPPGLRSELELCVNEQLDSFLDDSTVKKIVAQFSEKGITDEQIEGLLGKRLDSLTKEDRQTLLGVWNSIKDGEATVAEVFSNGEHPPFNPSKVTKKPEPPAPPETGTAPGVDGGQFHVDPETVPPPAAPPEPGQLSPPQAAVAACPECGGKKHGRGYQHADRCSKARGAAPAADPTPAPEATADDPDDATVRGYLKKRLIAEFEKLEERDGSDLLHQWKVAEHPNLWPNVRAVYDKAQTCKGIERKIDQVQARLSKPPASQDGAKDEN